MKLKLKNPPLHMIEGVELPTWVTELLPKIRPIRFYESGQWNIFQDHCGISIFSGTTGHYIIRVADELIRVSPEWLEENYSGKPKPVNRARAASYRGDFIPLTVSKGEKPNTIRLTAEDGWFADYYQGGIMPSLIEPEVLAEFNRLAEEMNWS